MKRLIPYIIALCFSCQVMAINKSYVLVPDTVYETVTEPVKFECFDIKKGGSVLYQNVKDAVIPLAYMEWGKLGKDICTYLYSFGEQAVYFIPNAINTTISLPGQIKNAVSETMDLSQEILKQVPQHFLKYFKKDMIDGVTQIAKNYFTGSPEEAGAAAFDVFITIAGFKKGMPVKGPVTPTENIIVRSAKAAVDQFPGVNVVKDGKVLSNISSVKTVTEGFIKEASVAKTEARHIISENRKLVKELNRKINIKRPKAKEEFFIKSKIRNMNDAIKRAEQSHASNSQLIEDMTALNDIMRLQKDLLKISLLESYLLDLRTEEESNQHHISSIENGGHSLNRSISTQIVGDKNMMSGTYRAITEGEQTIIYINPADLNIFESSRLHDPASVRQSAPDIEGPRDIEQVIPQQGRTSRGL